MTSIPVSDALLRTRLVSRGPQPSDERYQNGEATVAARQPHKNHATKSALRRLVKRVRPRPTPEKRAMEVARRRKWGGSGSIPADIRGLYTEAERAALSVIAERCKERGFCDLCLDEIAAIAGIGRTSVQNAIRKARSLAHLWVRERPQASGKNLTNILKILCKTWKAWILRAIGFKRAGASGTSFKTSLFENADTEKSAFERECAAGGRAQSRGAGAPRPRFGENWSDWMRRSAPARG